MIGHRGNEEIL